MSLPTEVEPLMPASPTWTTTSIVYEPTAPTVFTAQSDLTDGYDKIALSSAVGTVSDNVYARIKFSNPFQQRSVFAGLTQTMTDTSAVTGSASKIDMGVKRDGVSVYPVIAGVADLTNPIGSVSDEYLIIQRSETFEIYRVSGGDYNSAGTYTCPLRTGSPYKLAIAMYSSGTIVEISGGTTSEPAVIALPGAPIFTSVTTTTSGALLEFSKPTTDGNSALTGYVLSVIDPNQQPISPDIDISISSTGYTYTPTAGPGTYTFRLYAVNSEGQSLSYAEAQLLFSDFGYLIYPSSDEVHYVLRVNTLFYNGSMVAPSETNPFSITLKSDGNADIVLQYTQQDLLVTLHAGVNAYSIYLGEDTTSTTSFDVSVESLTIGFEQVSSTPDSVTLQIVPTSYTVSGIDIYAADAYKGLVLLGGQGQVYMSDGQFIVTGLTPDTTYNWTVKYYSPNNYLGCAGKVTQSVTFTSGPPVPISGSIYPIRYVENGTTKYKVKGLSLTDGMGSTSFWVADFTSGNQIGSAFTTTAQSGSVSGLSLIEDQTYSLKSSVGTVGFETSESIMCNVTAEGTGTDSAVVHIDGGSIVYELNGNSILDIATSIKAVLVDSNGDEVGTSTYDFTSDSFPDITITGVGVNQYYQLFQLRIEATLDGVQFVGRNVVDDIRFLTHEDNTTGTLGIFNTDNGWFVYSDGLTGVNGPINASDGLLTNVTTGVDLNQTSIVVSNGYISGVFGFGPIASGINYGDVISFTYAGLTKRVLAKEYFRPTVTIQNVTSNGATVNVTVSNDNILSGGQNDLQHDITKHLTVEPKLVSLGDPTIVLNASKNGSTYTFSLSELDDESDYSYGIYVRGTFVASSSMYISYPFNSTVFAPVKFTTLKTPTGLTGKVFPIRYTENGITRYAVKTVGIDSDTGTVTNLTIKDFAGQTISTIGKDDTVYNLDLDADTTYKLVADEGELLFSTTEMKNFSVAQSKATPTTVRIDIVAGASLYTVSQNDDTYDIAPFLSDIQFEAYDSVSGTVYGIGDNTGSMLVSGLTPDSDKVLSVRLVGKLTPTKRFVGSDVDSFTATTPVAFVSGTVIPIKVISGWWLALSGLQEAGSPPVANGSITVKNLTTDTSVDIITYTAPTGYLFVNLGQSLTYGGVYSLDVGGKNLDFYTTETLSVTTSVGSITHSSAVLTIQFDPSQTYLSSNSGDIVQFLTGAAFKLYDSTDTLVDEVDLSQTPPTITLTGLSASTNYSGYYVKLAGTTSDVNSGNFDGLSYLSDASVPIGAFTTSAIPASLLSANVTPVHDNSGSWYLDLKNVTYDGSPLDSVGIEIVDTGETVVGSFTYSGDQIYGPFALSAGQTYALKYSDNTQTFNTTEVFDVTVTINHTDTTADIVITVPNSGIAYKCNGNDIAEFIVGYPTFTVYGSGGSLESILYDRTSTDNTYTVTVPVTAGTSYSGWYVEYSADTYISGSEATYVGLATKSIPTFTGGGGSGGGGNNGGNGHNNMADLEFSYAGYTGAVTQTNTITVLGEMGGALTADDTFVVHVTKEELSKALAYKGNWLDTTGEETGEQARPDVKFLPVLACGARLEDMYSKLSTRGTGAEDSDGRKWKDSAATKHARFGNVMLGVSFTNSWLDDDEMPREAIRKIDEGELEVPQYFATSDAGSVVKDLTSTAVGAPKALLEGLFEQAVAAGKIVGDAVAGNNQGSPVHADAALAADGWKQAVFADGDSISFLVTFTYNKTRDYKIDDEETGSGSGNTKTTTKSITVAGTTYEIVATDEESDEKTETYIIKLLADAAPTGASDAA